jgi:hypothetical protein
MQKLLRVMLRDDVITHDPPYTDDAISHDVIIPHDVITLDICILLEKA